MFRGLNIPHFPVSILRLHILCFFYLFREFPLGVSLSHIDFRVENHFKRGSLLLNKALVIFVQFIQFRFGAIGRVEGVHWLFLPLEGVMLRWGHIPRQICLRRQLQREIVNLLCPILYRADSFGRLDRL